MTIKSGGDAFLGSQVIVPDSDPSTKHPDYIHQEKDWDRIRDCMQSESFIKSKTEKYLPRQVE